MHTKIVNEIYYTETYSEVDIKELCSIGEIAPEDLNNFQTKLEDFAAISRLESARYENFPLNRDIKRELQDVSKYATRLLRTLENLSWQAQKKIDGRADADGFKEITGESSENDEPSLAISLSHIESDAQCVIIDIPTLRSLLGGLAIAAEAETAEIPHGRSGRNRSRGLRLWMHNIENLWQDVSDQPFTRDVTPSNEPINSAARFCVAAYQMINPQCPASLIMYEMKECIKGSRRRTKRIAAL